MLGRYEPVEQLSRAQLDALIVTGAEPRAAEIEKEAYWPSLARVVDWSGAERVPTIWSCLAAHAAVSRASGVHRRRLPAKHSGVFELQIAGGHQLVEQAPSEPKAPHSRLHDLDARELEDAGYEVLARSPYVGVDTFVGRAPALHVFFQGHPEYDANALAREYLRDVSRYLRGDRDLHPTAPIGYFDPQTLRALQELSERAISTHGPELLNEYSRAVQGRTLRTSWRPWAIHMYREWLRYVSTVKTARPGRAAAGR
jgi:homoserine O-succinyltransferase/O-acetyltransferase